MSQCIGYEYCLDFQFWHRSYRFGVSDRKVAVIFPDISGFTPLTALLSSQGRVGAEKLSRILNNYFGQMISIITRNAGNLLPLGSFLGFFPGFPSLFSFFFSFPRLFPPPPPPLPLPSTSLSSEMHVRVRMVTKGLADNADPDRIVHPHHSRRKRSYGSFCPFFLPSFLPLIPFPSFLPFLTRFQRGHLVRALLQAGGGRPTTRDHLFQRGHLVRKGMQH
jgi:hypothetical protein